MTDPMPPVSGIVLNTMSSTELRGLLRKVTACPESVKWLGKRDLLTAWNECERGDWLLWVAGRLNIKRMVLVRAAARCAETALQYVPTGEDRPRRALEASLKWSDNPTAANLELVRVAQKDAADAAYAASASAYASASASAYAAASAGGGGARTAALARCADIVREIIPFSAILTAAQQRLGG